MMIYKFLNTIIDDLFAFIITMPWLKRLSCFRDGFFKYYFILTSKILRYYISYLYLLKKNI